MVEIMMQGRETATAPKNHDYLETKHLVDIGIGLELSYSEIIKSNVLEHEALDIDHIRSLFKRVLADAENIFFFLKEENFLEALPIYIGLLNIYKLSLGITNAFSMNLAYTATQEKLLIIKAQEKDKRENERILIQNSKLAVLGEMLSSIVHQWKQPLSVITGLIDVVREDFKSYKFSKEENLKTLETVKKTAHYMNDTLNLFGNYFKADRSKIVYSLNETMNETIMLIQDFYFKSGIKISFDSNELELTCFGYPNEFKQVILNLIKNSKDAILGNKKIPGKIIISFEETDLNNIIKFMDNGGGIDSELLPNGLFDPYITSKAGNEGTGIGLSMSRTIIEKRFNGRIFAQNDKEGAVFLVELPKCNITI